MLRAASEVAVGAGAIAACMGSAHRARGAQEPMAGALLCQLQVTGCRTSFLSPGWKTAAGFRVGACSVPARHSVEMTHTYAGC